MKQIILVLIFVPVLMACAQRKVGGPCEACDMMYEGMPAKIDWQTQISSPDEDGEPMIISGTIYKKDGRTPAPNVILYVYHTDSKGVYSPAPKQTQARRHGHLRGWMKSNEQGKYQFRSIRPAAYPGRNNPAHIHPLIKEDGLGEYWVDEYLFDDDPLLTSQERDHQEKRGGNGIIKLTKNSKGEWVGNRDIILGQNVPGY